MSRCTSAEEIPTCECKPRHRSCRRKGSRLACSLSLSGCLSWRLGSCASALRGWLVEKRYDRRGDRSKAKLATYRRAVHSLAGKGLRVTRWTRSSLTWCPHSLSGLPMLNVPPGSHTNTIPVFLCRYSRYLPARSVRTGGLDQADRDVSLGSS